MKKIFLNLEKTFEFFESIYLFRALTELVRADLTIMSANFCCKLKFVSSFVLASESNTSFPLNSKNCFIIILKNNYFTKNRKYFKDFSVDCQNVNFSS